MSLISHTPTWVWVAFIVLVIRGIKALQDRTMALSRLILLPVIFLIWGGYALGMETHMSSPALLSGVMGLMIGGVIGWYCWRMSPGLKTADTLGHVIRAGSVLPLVFILAAFASRFVMAAYLHTHHDALSEVWVMIGVGVWSGAIDGVFWGGSFNLLWRYREQLRQRSEVKLQHG